MYQILLVTTSRSFSSRAQVTRERVQDVDDRPTSAWQSIFACQSEDGVDSCDIKRKQHLATQLISFPDDDNDNRAAIGLQSTDLVQVPFYNHHAWTVTPCSGLANSYHSASSSWSNKAAQSPDFI